MPVHGRRPGAATAAFLSLLLLPFAANTAHAQLGAVAGQVTGPGGQPVPGAAIRLLGTDRASTTDHRGRFLLPGIRPGRHSLVVHQLSFHPDTAMVAVETGGLSTLEVRLEIDAILLPGVTVRVARSISEEPGRRVLARSDSAAVRRRRAFFNR